MSKFLDGASDLDGANDLDGASDLTLAKLLHPWLMALVN